MVARRWWGGIGIALAVISLSACTKEVEMKEKKQASQSGSEIVALDAGAITLEVRNGSGKVTIRAGEATDQVEVDYTKTAYGETDAAAQDELAHMTVEIRQAGDRVIVNGVQTLYTDHPRTNQVDLTITVPAQVALDVDHGAGDLRIEGVQVAGLFQVKLGAGNLTLRGVQALAGMSLDLGAGNLDFQGALGGEGAYTATVSAGNLTLRLPLDASAQVDARSGAGQVFIEKLALKDKDGGRSNAAYYVTGTLGDGGPRVTLRVGAGNITLSGQGD